MHTWRSTSCKQQLSARLLNASHCYTNAFRCNDEASYELHRGCCARARCNGASMCPSALFALFLSLCDQSAFARLQDASIKSTQMPLRHWLLSASLDSLVGELGNQAPQQMPPNNQHSHTQRHHRLHQQVASVPQNSYTVYEQQLRPLLNTQRRSLLPEPFEPPSCPSATPQPSTPNRWNSERNLHPKSCSLPPQFADLDQELELEPELVSGGDYYQPTGDSGSLPEGCYDEFDLDELLAEAGASFTYIKSSSPPPPQPSTADHPQHRFDSATSFRSVSAANEWLLGAQQKLQLDKQHQPLTSDSWTHLRTVSSLSAPFFRQPVAPLAPHTSTLSLQPATASNRRNKNCDDSYTSPTSACIAMPVLHQQRLSLPSSPLMLRYEHQHQQKPQYQHEQAAQSSHRSHSSNYNNYSHQHQNSHHSNRRHYHRQSSRQYNSTPAEAENERPAASASKTFQQQFRFDDQSVERLESSAVESDSAIGVSMLPLAAVNKMPLSVAEKMRDEASEFVTRQRRLAGKTKVRVRRTLKVKIRKSKPMLGIAIEGGYNVSGQLLPRIVCVHEDGAAYECGKLRASDLILEVNGTQTCNMSHDQIAKTIADAYYIDKRPHIEFLIGESVQV